MTDKRASNGKGQAMTPPSGREQEYERLEAEGKRTCPGVVEAMQVYGLYRSYLAVAEEYIRMTRSPRAALTTNATSP